MAISTIVARGFGSFGGGVNKVPTRGYGIGVPDTYQTHTGIYQRPSRAPTYERRTDHVAEYTREAREATYERVT